MTLKKIFCGQKKIESDKETEPKQSVTNDQGADKDK